MNDIEISGKMSHEALDVPVQKALCSVDDIVIDSKLPTDKRMEKFLEDVGNPYCFLCGDTVVRVCFSETGKDLDSHLLNFFKGLKNG
ncbi:DUF6870 family protein [Thomasclavelia sp.]